MSPQMSPRDELCATLRGFLDAHGEALLDDPQRLRSMLADLMRGSCAVEIRALLWALQGDLRKNLAYRRRHGLSSLPFLAADAQALVAEGLREDLALWSVGTWVELLTGEVVTQPAPLPVSSAPAPPAAPPTPPTAELIATFNATTGWAGKTITYEQGRFTLAGHDPISAADVLSYDRQGSLSWAHELLREWVAGLAEGSAAAKVVASGADDFLASIEVSPAEKRPLLKKLADWALALEREGLARLSTTSGTTGRKMLRPLVPGEGAGLVTIWNENGASIGLWRSVFERRAPHSIATVEALAGIELGVGRIALRITDELLDALTEAYREAARQGGDDGDR